MAQINVINLLNAIKSAADGDIIKLSDYAEKNENGKQEDARRE